MCDTFRPLKLSTLSRELDDGKYALSWYESTEEADSAAGVTSHF
jgi:homogentisate 1,2-dioxygenase